MRHSAQLEKARDDRPENCQPPVNGIRSCPIVAASLLRSRGAQNRNVLVFIDDDLFDSRFVVAERIPRWTEFERHGRARPPVTRCTCSTQPRVHSTRPSTYERGPETELKAKRKILCARARRFSLACAMTIQSRPNEYNPRKRRTIITPI